MREKIEYKEHLAFYQVKISDLGISSYSKKTIKQTYFIPSDWVGYGSIPLIYALVVLMVHKRFKDKKIKFIVPLNKKEEFYDTFEVALGLRGFIKYFRKFKKKGLLDQPAAEEMMRIIIKTELNLKEAKEEIIITDREIRKLFPNMRVYFTKRKKRKKKEVKKCIGEKNKES